MELKPARLRQGEVVAGVSGLALVVFLFALPWFAAAGGHVTVSGWTALPVLRWLILVTGLVAVLLTATQVALSTPALPVTLSVFVTVLGGVTTLAVILRLITIDSSLRVGSLAGLLATIGIAVGGFWSLRREDGWIPGPDHPIETISLPRPNRS